MHHVFMNGDELINDVFGKKSVNRAKIFRGAE
jgi:hypothetical protein